MEGQYQIWKHLREGREEGAGEGGRGGQEGYAALRPAPLRVTPPGPP